MPGIRQNCIKCKRYRIIYQIGNKAGLCKYECGRENNLSSSQIIPNNANSNRNTNNDSLTLDTSTCPTCNLECTDDQKLMSCQSCKKYFHVEKCCNVSESKFEIIEREGLMEIFMWFCEVCGNKVLEALKKIDDMDNRLSNLENNLNPSMDKIISEKVDEYLTEHFEIEKRKKKIIIYGLPECPSVISTNDSEGNEVSRPAVLKDRTDFDKNKLCELTTAIPEIKFDNNVVVKCNRFGAVKDDVVRPLGVELISTDAKRSILSNTSKLREEGIADWLASVNIKPDLTIKQREKYKEARAEKLRREENGETNLVIRNNRVVVFTPR